MAVGWCEPVEAGLKTQRGAGFGSCSLRFEVGCLWLTVPADVVMPGVVGRAHTPSLARERDDERLRALCAEGAGEPEAEQPTREIPTKLLFDECRDRHQPARAYPNPCLYPLLCCSLLPSARTCNSTYRMGWDLNPRDAFTPAGFQDRCIQPLCHPSCGLDSLSRRRLDFQRPREERL